MLEFIHNFYEIVGNPILATIELALIGIVIFGALFFLVKAFPMIVKSFLVKKPTINPPDEQAGESDEQADGERKYTETEEEKLRGREITPFLGSVVYRPVVSLIAGQLLAWSAFLLLLPLPVSPAWWVFFGIGVLLSVFFAVNDEPVEVPVAHVAVITFFGTRIRYYLKEGLHTWYAKSLFFDYSRDPVPDASGPGEEQGFVFIGKRVLVVKPRGESGEVLKNVAGDTSDIEAELTVTVQTIDPVEWAESSSPILDILERSRSAFRTAVAFFTGIDSAAVKSVLGKLMSGEEMFAYFTGKPYDTYAKGSILRNYAGKPIFAVTELNGPIPFTAEDAKNDLLKQLKTADTEMLKHVQYDEAGEPMIEDRKITEHVLNVIHRNGAMLNYASVSDISLSNEVSTQANTAAGENLQRVAQKLSAGTIAEVQKILDQAIKDGSEAALMAALAKDDHADIIFVPGAGEITRAAVSAAKTHRG